MRLEQENDDLAHELVDSKLTLKSELDEVHKCLNNCYLQMYFTSANQRKVILKT